MHFHHVPASAPHDHAVLIAILGACATVLVAIIAGLWAYLAGKREQRRLLYSEAVKAAVGWKEMLYRVRRREKGQERELINKFHDLQDQIAYYQAWIGSESEHMQRSYDRLVAAVKERTESLITAAWNEDIRPVPGNARPDDEHPKLSDLTDSFLVDVRAHLSPWWWQRRKVRERNPKEG
jgi:hypothetical protein